MEWKRADGTTVPGYTYGDSGPGVIVLQEWWGIDDEVKAHAKKISEQGYRTLVPDLYRGKLGVEAEEAQHLMDGLDWPGAVDDIRGAVDHLKPHGPVGIIGFCMGGALTLASGVLVVRLASSRCVHHVRRGLRRLL